MRLDADLRVIEDRDLKDISTRLGDMKECERAIQPINMDPGLSSVYTPGETYD